MGDPLTMYTIKSHTQYLTVSYVNYITIQQKFLRKIQKKKKKNQRQEGSFGENKNVLYLNLGGGYLGVYVKKSLTHTHKM